jgi:hypothetical protein
MTLDCLELSATTLPADALDEPAARRALRGQIARLERELVEQRCSSWPRAMREEPLRRGDDRRMGPGRLHADPGLRRAGPGLLSIGELETLRDELVATLAAQRRALGTRGAAEEECRRLREELLLDPAANAGARVTNADVGEGGCGEVRSAPAGGLLGMLMAWWRVVISSGCPRPEAALA